MLRRTLLAVAGATFLVTIGCDGPLIAPPDSASYHHAPGHRGGPPGSGGGDDDAPTGMVVRVSNDPELAIRGDGPGDYTDYEHGDCISAVSTGAKLLQFASAVDRSDCNTGAWRGLLFPKDLFKNDSEIDGVGELPEAGEARQGAVLNLDVFNDGTFNLWIRAVGSEGTLLDFSKWNIGFGSVETTEEDGWTVIRLEPGAAPAVIGERYSEPHPSGRQAPRLRWANAGDADLPLEIRFKQRQ